MVYSKISGVGVYLPKRIVTNDDFLDLGVDTSDKWIKDRTGIRSRHVASPDETVARMAIEASKAAIGMANERFGRREVEYIKVATNTSVTNPDSAAGFPCTGSYIQPDLGELARELCPFSDLQSGCAGINFGFYDMDAYIRAGFCKRVLLVGVDLLTGITDLEDRETCVMLSDGASAYVFDASDEPGFIGHRLYGDGSQRHAIISPMRERTPINYPEAKIMSPTIAMKGRAVYKFVKRVILDTLSGFGEDEVLNPLKYRIEVTDIARIISHQANLRMIEAAVDKLVTSNDFAHLGLTREQLLEMFVVTIQNIGNNSVASQGPGALEVLVGENALPQGSHVLMMGYGAGLSWGINHYIV